MCGKQGEKHFHLFDGANKLLCHISALNIYYFKQLNPIIVVVVIFVVIIINIIIILRSIFTPSFGPAYQIEKGSNVQILKKMFHYMVRFYFHNFAVVKFQDF